MPSDSLILGIDTATRLASVALCRGEAVLAEQTREVTTHSEGLLATVEQVLTEGGVAVSDLDGVACGRGPGSFTGLRIGMATAKGLCFAAGLPLICPSSLVSLAAQTDEALGEGDHRVLTVLDARRKEVFCGLYRHGERLAPEWVCRPDRVAEHLPDADEPVILAGDGALLYREVLLDGLDGATLAPDTCHTIAARYLAFAAAARLARGASDNLHTAVPHYIRASDARLPKIPQNA